MLLPVLDLAIVFHCVVFGIFFLFRKGGVGRTNTFLGILMVLLGLMSLQFALKPTGWIFDFPYLTDIEWAAGFFFVPVYYWYVREMTGESIKFTYKELLHLIPGTVAFLYFSKYYFKSGEEKLEYLKLIQSTYIEDYQTGDALFYPYVQGFFIYCIVLLYKRQSKVSGVFLNNLRWLKTYTMVLLGFGFFGAAIYFLELPQQYIDALPLFSAAIYMMLIYRFLQQSGKSYDTTGQAQSQPKRKYSGSNLAFEDAERLNQQLQEIMEGRKVYLNQELTLQILATEIQSTPHHLSQVINQFHQKNFSDYVNTYRIKEAQNKIRENESYKLEAIGYDCGFNTKTTFNAAFKKFSGCTPSEYRKKFAQKDVQIYKS